MSAILAQAEAPPAAPTLADIQAAAGRLRGKAVLTPLLESPFLNERIGGRVLVKAEPLQRTGSFKFRGAFNRISLIPESERARGVVAFSSGNHAQGVAAAAKAFGMRATIVMPSDAPAIKVRNTRGYGAEVVLYDRFKDDREAIGAEIARETGATLVKPYDDPGLIAGQGTIGLEILDQAEQAGAALDAVVVPAGGGGLIAGISTAIGEQQPGIGIYSAEPEGFDDTARSLASGTRLPNEAGRFSWCDALLAPMPGEITFPINAARLRGGLAVSDQEVATAMAVAFDMLKLVVEPGGSVALAAVLSGKLKCQGLAVAVVCSGGNVDPATYRDALAAG